MHGILGERWLSVVINDLSERKELPTRKKKLKVSKKISKSLKDRKWFKAKHLTNRKLFPTPTKKTDIKEENQEIKEE